MIPKVLDWLETQGFTLEMRAASAFRAAGFEVRQSSHYVDPETGKDREIDVIAIDPDIIGVVSITFLLECKASKKPWVLLCSPDTLAGYNRLFSFGALSEQAISEMVDRMTELLPKFDWLRKEGLIGYSARQAFSDVDVAYAAAIGLAKACDSWVHRPKTGYVPPYIFAFPVMVVDSPILQCSLGGDGSTHVLEVQSGEFLFDARLSRDFGSCIRVVSVDRLATFAREAKSVADLLRAEFKTSERRIVDSWHTPRSK